MEAVTLLLALTTFLTVCDRDLARRVARLNHAALCILTSFVDASLDVAIDGGQRGGREDNR
jgi:hypothetical protein